MKCPICNDVLLNKYIEWSLEQVCYKPNHYIKLVSYYTVFSNDIANQYSLGKIIAFFNNGKFH